jgi:hypothetical protein
MPKRALVALVKLGVLAMGAGDGGEFLGLDIEYLGQTAPGRPEFAGFESALAAFGAFVTLGHRHSFLLIWGGISYNTRYNTRSKS